MTHSFFESAAAPLVTLLESAAALFVPLLKSAIASLAPYSSQPRHSRVAASGRDEHDGALGRLHSASRGVHSTTRDGEHGPYRAHTIVG